MKRLMNDTKEASSSCQETKASFHNRLSILIIVIYSGTLPDKGGGRGYHLTQRLPLLGNEATT
ncbi:hypothetical protein B7P43_G05182 [Cryptotermes secundus]|uniref:Uncharacterized protein n=1 Tax=Cryptotermes secundus TaxID=105785 RepID=A0A2J7QAA6_9NEOP|nr:hypothetical protein B7P43_G05182 [Cryptotermes secundus]